MTLERECAHKRITHSCRTYIITHSLHAHMIVWSMCITIYNTIAHYLSILVNLLGFCWMYKDYRPLLLPIYVLRDGRTLCYGAWRSWNFISIFARSSTVISFEIFVVVSTHLYFNSSRSFLLKPTWDNIVKERWNIWYEK